MKRTRTTLTCDHCSAEVVHENDADPADWSTPTLPMGGRSVECAICPKCIGDFLDPADDIAAEVLRFKREDRIA